MKQPIPRSKSKTQPKKQSTKPSKRGSGTPPKKLLDAAEKPCKTLPERLEAVSQLRDWSRGTESRLRVVATRLVQVANVEVSLFTIHKWFSGAARPTPDNIEQLARLFEVEEEWLSFGR